MFGVMLFGHRLLQQIRKLLSWQRSTSGGELLALAKERGDYRIYVAIPPTEPTAWARVSTVTRNGIVLDDLREMALRDVTAYLVAYSNGQLLRRNLVSGLPGGGRLLQRVLELELPDGLSGLEPSERQLRHVIRLEDLDYGNQFLRVSYGRDPSSTPDQFSYSTTVTNISDLKVRVLLFGGFQKTEHGWVLSTVTGGHYSADEFKQWYGLGERDWIFPGNAVCDPHNYGDPPCLWAYYCESETGEHFVAGAVLE